MQRLYLTPSLLALLPLCFERRQVRARIDEGLAGIAAFGLAHRCKRLRFRCFDIDGLHALVDGGALVEIATAARFESLDLLARALHTLRRGLGVRPRLGKREHQAHASIGRFATASFDGGVAARRFFGALLEGAALFVDRADTTPHIVEQRTVRDRART